MKALLQAYLEEDKDKKLADLSESSEELDELDDDQEEGAERPGADDK